MSAIKVNVHRQPMPHGQEDCYRARVTNYSRLDANDVIRRVSRNTGFSEPMLKGAVAALEQELTQMMLNGHIVDFGDLGTFRVSVSCHAPSRRDKVDASCVRRRRIIFSPSSRLRESLQDVEFEGFGE